MRTTRTNLRLVLDWIATDDRIDKKAVFVQLRLCFQIMQPNTPTPADHLTQNFPADFYRRSQQQKQEELLFVGAGAPAFGFVAFRFFAKFIYGHQNSPLLPPGGPWKGLWAIKTLAAKVSDAAKQWLVKQTLWQLFPSAPKTHSQTKISCFHVKRRSPNLDIDVLFCPTVLHHGGLAAPATLCLRPFGLNKKDFLTVRMFAIFTSAANWKVVVAVSLIQFSL